MNFNTLNLCPNMYFETNDMIRLLLSNITNNKLKNYAELWLELLEKPRTDGNFPDDMQRVVQQFFFRCITANILIGPFKKTPEQYTDPICYVASKYSHFEFRNKIRNESIRLMEKELPLDTKKTDCVAILQQIPHFGFHYFITSKDILDWYQEGDNMPMGAFKIINSKCQTNQVEQNATLY